MDGDSINKRAPYIVVPIRTLKLLVRDYSRSYISLPWVRIIIYYF
jgi:hypothetical protein